MVTIVSAMIFPCAHLHTSACKYIALLLFFSPAWLAGLIFVIPRSGGDVRRDDGVGVWLVGRQAHVDENELKPPERLVARCRVWRVLICLFDTSCG
jgi:hypothetical protein